MENLHINVPILMPRFMAEYLRRIKRQRHIRKFGYKNIIGDRDVEYSWIASRLPQTSGTALDFGCGRSGTCGFMAAQKGFKVTAVDLENVEWPFVHPNLVFQQGDMLLMTFPSEYFDLILNCSSVEHVGLAGRYSVSEANEDGDLKVMNRLRDMLKFSGRMLLTVPIGIDSVFAPLARIYGKKRLPKLLDGYDIEEECYWIKDEHNRWILCDKNHALSFPASAGSWDHTRNIYALGCFSLKRAI